MKVTKTIATLVAVERDYGPAHRITGDFQTDTNHLTVRVQPLGGKPQRIMTVTRCNSCRKLRPYGSTVVREYMLLSKGQKWTRHLGLLCGERFIHALDTAKNDKRGG
jgi:hypothetical protein